MVPGPGLGRTCLSFHNPIMESPLPAVCPLVSKENEKRLLLSGDPEKSENKNPDHFLLQNLQSDH